MIKLENCEVMGWQHAVRGMRNPMNSWDKSDSEFKAIAETKELTPGGKIKSQQVYFDALGIGENDHDLMMRLVNGGPVHAKFRRMITVYVDITAPLYWWKEFDTYKVGTVANSCSTMHKIHAKEFTLEDFSCDHLMDNCGLEIEFTNEGGCTDQSLCGFDDILRITVDALNFAREQYIITGEKCYWWQMIQLLPTSYNQKRTVMLNYEVLANIYEWRKNHKLDEWREFCQWIESLPYSEIIIGKNVKEE